MFASTKDNIYATEKQNNLTDWYTYTIPWPIETNMDNGMTEKKISVTEYNEWDHIVRIAMLFLFQ
jgi:hypothetical protein